MSCTAQTRGASKPTYERDTDAVYIKGSDKKTDLSIADKDMPIIKRDYYQEITGKSWRFKNALMPADAPVREYRLWYQGVTDALEDAPELANADDTTAAETLLDEICGQMADCVASTNPPPLNVFLMRYCALYCVARPAAAA